MATTYTRNCPDCGAENDSNDFFCKDCGTSLAGASNASQQTAAFTLIDNVDETQTTTVAPAVPPQTDGYTPVPTPAAQPATYSYSAQPESSRGAVLGWVAATLMLIVVAAFVWSSVISDAARDRITGIF